jgi:hypothetical protein
MLRKCAHGIVQTAPGVVIVISLISIEDGNKVVGVIVMYVQGLRIDNDARILQSG